MKQGTVSVLLGCHSPVHSIIVWVTWWKIYKKPPCFWETVCIFIHDIGHWGKDYLDDYELKKQHGVLGSKIAYMLFGQKGYDLIAGHNQYNGADKSKLYYPDKQSWLIAPMWWLISNTIVEPKLRRLNTSRRESAIMFKEAIRENITKGYPELGHEIYLKQWGHYNNEQNTD